jgi:hypothetical protein
LDCGGPPPLFHGAAREVRKHHICPVGTAENQSKTAKTHKIWIFTPRKLKLTAIDCSYIKIEKNLK